MKKLLTLLTFICILFYLSECMDYSSFEQIDKKIAKLKRKEEFFVNSVKIKKQKYEEACKSLEETRNEIGICYVRVLLYVRWVLITYDLNNKQFKETFCFDRHWVF